MPSQCIKNYYRCPIHTLWSWTEDIHYYVGNAIRNGVFCDGNQECDRNTDNPFTSGTIDECNESCIKLRNETDVCLTSFLAVDPFPDVHTSLNCTDEVRKVTYII